MITLVTEKQNQVRFRFVDTDDFWLKDSVIPLNEASANNYQTTVIDSYHKDDCGNLNKLVFHGRMDDIKMPDYRWVEDGKLLFGEITILEPPKEPSEEENLEDNQIYRNPEALEEGSTAAVFDVSG